MTQEKMEELAKAAANAALLTQRGLTAESAVEFFLKAYEYAMKRLNEKQHQAQENSNQSGEKSRFQAIREGTVEFKHGKRL